MVDRIDNDFARAQLLGLPRHLDRRTPGVVACIVGPDFVFAEQGLLDVEHHYHALAANLGRHRRDQLWVGQRRRTDRHLFDAQADNVAGLLHRLDATAVTQRHAAFGGELGDQPQVGLAAQCAGVDVEHHQFVGFLLVEDLDRVDRIADVLRVAKAHRLDQATFVYQQAGNDSWP